MKKHSSQYNGRFYKEYARTRQSGRYEVQDSDDDNIAAIAEIVEKKNRERHITILDKFVLRGVMSGVRVTCIITEQWAYICEYSYDSDNQLAVYDIPDETLYELIFS